MIITFTPAYHKTMKRVSTWIPPSARLFCLYPLKTIWHFGKLILANYHLQSKDN